ncbi:MAG: hypothetical protein ABMA02_09775, partial [Saprospiraceae bacterium]
KYGNFFYRNRNPICVFSNCPAPSPRFSDPPPSFEASYKSGRFSASFRTVRIFSAGTDATSKTNCRFGAARRH